jgi:two-component sensor histidine kinase
LIVNELITNAAKYAYQGQSGGKIWISVARVGNDAFAISVRDEGAGLPADFDLRQAKGLGMRIVNSFGEQLNAKVVTRARDPGTEFVVSIPLRVCS